ncbi:hypothetical protein OEZ86_005688 [Tetradesmus obliquus]|uniref:Uncharacterized protein n=2 Tax=Tetradesmus obliquus TaxID=3088 RepID=A0ABY8UE67_TETOB|nr:hypothetical protein OEZ85_003971 [Tetradesmus obliquus]WIA39606.1 hypothetical protein OEZ86_005688 [Tetradesmus obliquus]|eukprot:jgi/Sobl393_1/8180/SZX64959.1
MNEIHRINPPTSVVLSERKYPVITNEPSWSQIFAGLRSDDYKLLLQSTAIGAPIGYWIGSKSHATRQGMIVGMLMCGGAGLAQVVQVSAARLLGVLENEAEYKQFVERPGK